MEEYYIWTRGDDEDVVECVIDKDDEYITFLSGNRCSTELMEDYMRLSDRDEYERYQKSKQPKSVPPINPNAIVGGNESTTVAYVSQPIQAKIDTSKLKKILALSPGETHEFPIVIPDKTTMLIMEVAGVSLTDMLFAYYGEKLKEKINEILDEDNDTA